ncbi:FtsK/SpoIIIE domain-containing protein, partial [Faecalibacillus faecis]|uniref:FtsK/SpoIIIE domain-containing protein n=1 Tax=Faecalibacillus faecis TaxID=1982628 RepID=UPI0022E6A312
MRKIWNKGHRIRASDKHLLLFVFVAVLLLLNIKQLMRTDWEHFGLFENGLTLSPYNFITILIATGVYYQMEKGLLHIRCEITLGKYQDQLLRLEDKLESGLYCELTDKTLHDGYIEYTLLYDMIANRYDALPHALIAGGTGGGKTYFLLTLIEALLHTNAVLYILDPKNADLADLGTVMGNVYHTKEEMIDCVNAFYEGMVQRSEEMKRHPNYKTGENYAYLGLPPCFLIFDEYVAFFEMLGTKESV